ncbi:hypothetical protein [Streptomyces sp. BBFR102]|uniref:hypothetical protein n=1 Tax=Streptomyces sp. BBFR102 TaxID=3448171 RepID=UPI003F52BD10
MRTTLAQARRHGLEPMDADECEPEVLEDGTVRIYLVPIEQPEATYAQKQEHALGLGRKTRTFILTACVAGALLTPSPLHFDYTPDKKHADTVSTRGY